MTIGMITGVLEQGLIYGVLALGLLITYRILDFPDLTVDSSFPLGAAVSAVLTVNGTDTERAGLPPYGYTIQYNKEDATL